MTRVTDKIYSRCFKFNSNFISTMIKFFKIIPEQILIDKMCHLRAQYFILFFISTTLSTLCTWQIFFFTSFNFSSAFVRCTASIESVAVSVWTKLTGSIFYVFLFLFFLIFYVSTTTYFFGEWKKNDKSNDWVSTPNQTHKKWIKKNLPEERITPGNARCSSSMTQALIIIRRLWFVYASKCVHWSGDARDTYMCHFVQYRTSFDRATLSAMNFIVEFLAHIFVCLNACHIQYGKKLIAPATSTDGLMQSSRIWWIIMFVFDIQMPWDFCIWSEFDIWYANTWW